MKRLIKVLILFTTLVFLGIIFLLLINAHVKSSVQDQMLTENDYTKLKNVDCVIVLGAGIWGDKPSPMLEDRLLEAIKLYYQTQSFKEIHHIRRNYYHKI